MPSYTITPWRQPSDLLEIRSNLYPIATVPQAQQQRAIQRIQAWKLRGNLPHAVESTALLLDAILHHSSTTDTSSTNDKSNNAKSQTSTFALRAVYSAAFTRFVTGFCDIGRSKERNAATGNSLLESSSMLEIARQIGMPAHFVTLRHEATHEELPGLPRLVRAAREGLEWLWGVYWVKLGSIDESSKAGSDGVETLAEATAQVSRALKEFRKARRDSLMGAGKKGERKASAAGKEAELVSGAREVCVRFCHQGAQRDERLRALVAVLANERLLMPSNRRLGQSLDGAYLIWDQLLEELSESLHNFRLSLVQSCLDELTKSATSISTNDIEREALVMWILHLVEQEESLASMVMQSCSLYPSTWMQQLGRQLLESQNEYALDWRDLFQASIGEIENETDTRQSEEAGSDLQMADADPALEAGATGWSRAILPLRTPIGIVVG